MDSVIIIAPQPYDVELKARLVANWDISEEAEQGWVIDDGHSRVYVSRNDSVKGELEPDRLTRITSTIREPVFYTVDFSDLGLCRRVLVSLADDPKLLVDNDHGVVLPGSEFARLLRRQEDWDWRDEAMPAP